MSFYNIIFSLKRFHVCFNIFVLLFFVTLCLAVAVQSCMSESQSKKKKKIGKRKAKKKKKKKNKKKKKKKKRKKKKKKKKKQKKSHFMWNIQSPKSQNFLYFPKKSYKIFFKGTL